MSDKNDKVSGGTASATITVACKLPSGLLLRLSEMGTSIVDVIGGGKREIKECINATDVTQVVKINGYVAPKGHLPAGEVVGIQTGFALTHNVPRDFFERWLEEHKSDVMVKKGLIFAADTAHRARDQAKEQEAMKNGMEALDPNNLPRLSRRMRIKKFDKNDDSVAA